MPVAERSGSSGQVLRGVCPSCGQTTKTKDPAGRWISQCAHPATSYHVKLVPGGKKTIPVIPTTVDRGRMPVPPGPLVDNLGPEGVPVALAVALGADPPSDQVRGMVDANEPREDEPKRERAPVAAAPGDPVTFDVRGALEGIASHARGLAGTLAAAQRRILQLETLVADGAIEAAGLRASLESAADQIEALESDAADAADDQRLDEELAEADALTSSALTAAEDEASEPVDFGL